MGSVSVVGAYYNRAALVRESVHDLLRQTHSDFEVILVNDGSTDDTLQALKAVDDPRLRIIDQPNGGFVAAIRRAIDESKGSYIAVHGSGDRCDRTLLAQQAAILDAHPHVGWVGTPFRNRDLVTGDTQERMIVVDLRSEYVANSPSALEGLPHGGAMYRRDGYDAVGGYRPFFRFAQDYDLWLRLSERTQFAMLEEVLYERFKLADGVSSAPHKLAWQRVLHDVAAFCAIERRAGRGDPLEKYGDLVLYLRPRSSKVGRELVFAAWRALRVGEDEWILPLLRAARRERISPEQFIRVGFLLVAATQPDLGRRVRHFKRRIADQGQR